MGSCHLGQTGNQLTFMLPRRLARSMTRNFLMRSLGGETETVSKSTALQHASKQERGEKSANVIQNQAKMTTESLLQVDRAVSP